MPTIPDQTAVPEESDPAEAAVGRTAVALAPEAEYGRRTRGVETVLRTAVLVNTNLTTLADRKASIVIGLNGILISLLLAQYAPRIGDDAGLVVRLGLVLFGCWASLFCGVKAALPRITARRDYRDAIESSRANPIFFANYVGMSEQEYVEVLTEAAQNQDRVYDSLLRDTFGAGQVLPTKFRYLSAAYVLLVLTLGTATAMVVLYGFDLV